MNLLSAGQYLSTPLLPDLAWFCPFFLPVWHFLSKKSREVHVLSLACNLVAVPVTLFLCCWVLEFCLLGTLMNFWE